MSDFQTIADRIEIEVLRGEFTDAAMMRLRPPRVAVHPGRALRMPTTAFCRLQRVRPRVHPKSSGAPTTAARG
jgi:hypothetical protein